MRRGARTLTPPYASGVCAPLRLPTARASASVGTWRYIDDDMSRMDSSDMRSCFDFFRLVILFPPVYFTPAGDPAGVIYWFTY
jgi:hypothetical protein